MPLYKAFAVFLKTEKNAKFSLANLSLFMDQYYCVKDVSINQMFVTNILYYCVYVELLVSQIFGKSL